MRRPITSGHYIVIQNNHKEKIAIVSHQGAYRFVRMRFVLCKSRSSQIEEYYSSYFSRDVQYPFSYSQIETMSGFLDRIIVLCKDLAQNLQHMDEFSNLVGKADMTL